MNCRKWLNYYSLHNFNFNLSVYYDSVKTVTFSPALINQLHRAHSIEKDHSPFYFCLMFQSTS